MEHFPVDDRGPILDVELLEAHLSESETRIRLEVTDLRRALGDEVARQGRSVRRDLAESSARLDDLRTDHGERLIRIEVRLMALPAEVARRVFAWLVPLLVAFAAVALAAR
jgi:hypothetical protein